MRLNVSQFATKKLGDSRIGEALKTLRNIYIFGFFIAIDSPQEKLQLGVETTAFNDLTSIDYQKAWTLNG